MEQKLQEQIRLVAEYDGWSWVEPTDTLQGYYAKHIESGIARKALIKDIDYHTNIASLYPVAVKVLSVLEEMQKNEYSMTISVMTQKIHDVAFDLDMLFIEIFDAIDYLNELNKNK